MSKLRNRYQESQITWKRLFLVSFCFIILYGILLGRLYQLQINKHKHYQILSEKNKNKEIYIAPYRAGIVDRHGQALASYETKFLLHIEDGIQDSDKTLIESKGISLSDKKSYVISKEQFAYLSNYTPQHVDLEARPYRYYPLGAASAHLVGYTGKMFASDYTFIETPLEGKLGIEKIYNSELFGQPGLQRQDKNARGDLFNTDILREPERSSPLELCIDARLQEYTYNLMLGHVGAAIVLNPNNGELLAAVSSPSFDPNAISKQDYNKRLDMLNKPMFNRLSQALYPPGSIVKPFIAIGALNDKLLDPNEFIDDPGYFKLNENSKVFHDHKRTGHGKVNLHRAIAISCDTYFYHLAQRIGIDKIVEYLQAYKLGDKTGIEISGEVKGILPTKNYRKMHYKKWYQGQTIISAIGQGDILFSPLQLARATMLLANQGHDYPLTCIKNNNADIPPIIPINETHRQLIIQAMEETVKTGTARKIKKKPYRIAAKTSTVQVVQLDDHTEYHRLPEHQKDHHMIVAFAPSQNTDVVVVIITEHQNEAIPIAEKILDWCYQEGYIASKDE